MNREDALEILIHSIDALTNQFVEQKVKNGGSEIEVYLSALNKFQDAYTYIEENLK